MSDEKSEETVQEESQQPVETPTVEAWDSERALKKIKKANAEAKSLRDRVKVAEAKVAEASSLEDELKSVRAELAEAKTSALRQKVAYTYGLDPVLAARLRGDSVEELQEDAQALLEVVQAGQRQSRRAPFVPHKDPNAVADGDIDSMVAGLL